MLTHQKKSPITACMAVKAHKPSKADLLALAASSTVLNGLPNVMPEKGMR